MNEPVRPRGGFELGAEGALRDLLGKREGAILPRTGAGRDHETERNETEETSRVLHWSRLWLLLRRQSRPIRCVIFFVNVRHGAIECGQATRKSGPAGCPPTQPCGITRIGLRHAVCGTAPHEALSVWPVRGAR